MADMATKPIVEDVSLKDLKEGLADGSIVLSMCASHMNMPPAIFRVRR